MSKRRRRVSQSKASRWKIQRFLMDLMPFGRYDQEAVAKIEKLALPEVSIVVPSIRSIRAAGKAMEKLTGRPNLAAHFEAQLVALGVIETRVYVGKKGKVDDDDDDE